MTALPQSARYEKAQHASARTWLGLGIGLGIRIGLGLGLGLGYEKAQHASARTSRHKDAGEI